MLPHCDGGARQGEPTACEGCGADARHRRRRRGGGGASRPGGAPQGVPQEAKPGGNQPARANLEPADADALLLRGLAPLSESAYQCYADRACTARAFGYDLVEADENAVGTVIES